MNTTPPPLAESAVRERLQRVAVEREQAGRQARQTQVLVYAERWRDRDVLKKVMSAAGLRVPLDASHQEVLGQYLVSAGGMGSPEQGFLLATTATELPALTAFACERDLDVLALAFTLSEALGLVAQIQTRGADWPHIGIVVDHPTDQALVPPQIADAVRRLRSATPTLPSLLTAPFAGTPLSSQEQAALTLALQGLSSTDIGARITASGSTVRTYFTRIREKVGLESDEAALLRWAEDWWFGQLQQAMSGPGGTLRERTGG